MYPLRVPLSFNKYRRPGQWVTLLRAGRRAPDGLGGTVTEFLPLRVVRIFERERALELPAVPASGRTSTAGGELRTVAVQAEILLADGEIDRVRPGDRVMRTYWDAARDERQPAARPPQFEIVHVNRMTRRIFL